MMLVEADALGPQCGPFCGLGWVELGGVGLGGWVWWVLIWWGVGF